MTQAHLAKVLNRSKAAISGYVRRGMPTESAEAARAWLTGSVNLKKRIPPASPAAREETARRALANLKATVAKLEAAIAADDIEDAEAFAWMIEEDSQSIGNHFADRIDARNAGSR